MFMSFERRTCDTYQVKGASIRLWYRFWVNNFLLPLLTNVLGFLDESEIILVEANYERAGILREINEVLDGEAGNLLIE